ncbi:U1 small nuclear ribonucleoprotein C-2-like [Homarus americanus]|uniref:U1 small nuclear ribonucleoprotein C-2-like n=1 Tax=Homarus americanus TaxID=6706 RepID=UPI001C44A9F0|nr:U1 small nuclear ribonucleoprotein C-2-like [Homarus americanus]
MPGALPGAATPPASLSGAAAPPRTLPGAVEPPGAVAHPRALLGAVVPPGALPGMPPNRSPIACFVLVSYILHTSSNPLPNCDWDFPGAVACPEALLRSSSPPGTISQVVTPLRALPRAAGP